MTVIEKIVIVYITVIKRKKECAIPSRP